MRIALSCEKRKRFYTRIESGRDTENKLRILFISAPRQQFNWWQNVMKKFSLHRNLFPSIKWCRYFSVAHIKVESWFKFFFNNNSLMCMYSIFAPNKRRHILSHLNHNLIKTVGWSVGLPESVARGNPPQSQIDILRTSRLQLRNEPFIKILQTWNLNSASKLYTVGWLWTVNNFGTFLFGMRFQ